jgi:energy-coupling factor transporter transmembrane protein EcfT
VLAPWHTLPGSARGPIARLAPQTRLLCAAAVLGVCLMARVTTVRGAALVLGAVLLWLALCRPPAAAARGALVLGLVLLSPAFLLTPLLRTDAGSWLAAAAAPWSIVGRGLAVMQVSVAAAATLSASDLRLGLVRLPVPEIARQILLQILQQTAALLGETRRVAAALAVRGGGLGPAARLRLLAALPAVWLPRVLFRAERVAAAMELRGLVEVELRALGVTRTSVADVLALATATLALAGAAALHLWGGG